MSPWYIAGPNLAGRLGGSAIFVFLFESGTCRPLPGHVCMAEASRLKGSEPLMYMVSHYTDLKATSCAPAEALTGCACAPCVHTAHGLDLAEDTMIRRFLRELPEAMQRTANCVWCGQARVRRTSCINARNMDSHAVLPATKRSC